MTIGGMSRRAVLLVVGGLVAVLVAAGVTAYAMRDTSDAHLARRVIGEVAAPSGDWHEAPAGVTQRRGQFLARWATGVRSGNEGAACTSATAWLLDTTDRFPGDPVDEESPPSPDRLQDWCLRALGRGGAGSDTIGAGRGTEKSGYQYGAYLEVRVGGQHPVIVAAAVARTTESTGA